VFASLGYNSVADIFGIVICLFWFEFGVWLYLFVFRRVCFMFAGWLFSGNSVAIIIWWFLFIYFVVWFRFDFWCGICCI